MTKDTFLLAVKIFKINWNFYPLFYLNNMKLELSSNM